MIRSVGKTERRVVLALLVTAIVPLLTAMWLASAIIQRVSSTAFQPEFGVQLDRSLGVYTDLVKAMKRSLRAEAASMAHSPALTAATKAEDDDAAQLALEGLLKRYPDLLSLDVEDDAGELRASVKRSTPVDTTRERPFTVRQPLPTASAGEGMVLLAVFAADRRRLDEIEEAQAFVQAYKRLEKDNRDAYLDRPYLTVFATLLGFTVLLAIIVGILVVRPATRRIKQLADATQPVAEGDLSVRVDEDGNDETAELARAFNHMLKSMDRSRARIEFLKRVGEWQTMARRLAHEIKNPLTPIQLAVEECHRRYDGESKGYKRLLQTTREIVVEEVASLRRLVGEFAEFARLPRANLEEGDLRSFLSEQKPRLLHDAEPAVHDRDVDLAIDVPAEGLPVALDRTMLYRVLTNLVANAAQAAAAEHPDSEARVRVGARRNSGACTLEVEDNGAGVEESMRETIFDPYVTSKQDGTGLGLTICKKVIIDHGGHIEVGASDLGGARFCITLPLLGTNASDAALAQSVRHPVSG